MLVYDYSYNLGSKNGPNHWGEISSECAICSKGKMQSPIEINPKSVKLDSGLKKVTRSYRPGNAVMVNRGSDIMLKWEKEVGRITINEHDYTLLQIHWHSPSEHTINGTRYPMEVHTVHKNTDGEIAVFGILYKLGAPDAFLTSMEKHMKNIPKKGAQVDAGTVDPRGVKKSTEKYYRYVGSLTAPPCTEGVIWTISEKVRTVSKEQVDILKETIGGGSEGNSRPLQNANGRTVGLYLP